MDNAKRIVPTPTPTNAQLRDYFERTVRDAHAVGLTSIHDASTDLQAITFYKEFASSRKLPVGVFFPKCAHQRYSSTIAPAVSHGFHRVR